MVSLVFSVQMPLFAQQIGQPDSLTRKNTPLSIPTVSDSNNVQKDSVVKKKFIPKPKKALLYSIIPGGGQVYNRKYWKVPLVYGAMGFGVWRVATLTTSYQELNLAYKEKKNDVKPLTNPKFENVDVSRISQARNSNFAALQRAYVLAGFIYLLQTAEAFTNAHLMNFDVSDDLSFRLKPSFETSPIMGSAVGFGVVLKW
ncbi:MAG: hypothetical protein HC817_02225 [Saprospiraceae bacterium]|nr:hypothetical protein [Saprospiraceae bacterium]